MRLRGAGPPNATLVSAGGATGKPSDASNSIDSFGHCKCFCDYDAEDELSQTKERPELDLGEVTLFTGYDETGRCPAPDSSMSTRRGTRRGTRAQLP